MPTRRTSPRRSATRPTGLYERPLERAADDEEPPAARLDRAAPWLALLAVVLAAGALGFVVFGRSGGDMTACRTAAWTAIPDTKDLPVDWNLGSTDLNANGMTISVLGPPPPDETTNQPVVYASVTCYGDAAATALAENRKAAKAAGSTVKDRSANGEAYDVDNPSTGSVTTLFRVSDLVGQVAGAGDANDPDLATITSALAKAMGDKAAAGTAPVSSDEPIGSEEPLGSEDPGAVEPSGSPYATELQALLPTSLGGTTLTFDARSATSYFQEATPLVERSRRACASSARRPTTSRSSRASTSPARSWTRSWPSACPAATWMPCARSSSRRGWGPPMPA